MTRGWRRLTNKTFTGTSNFQSDFFLESELLLVVESDPLWVLPNVVGIIPPLNIGATLDGLILPEEMVGGGVLAMLLPPVTVHKPQTRLLGLLAVNATVGVLVDHAKGRGGHQDETNGALPQIGRLPHLGNRALVCSTVQGKLFIFAECGPVAEFLLS